MAVVPADAVRAESRRFYVAIAIVSAAIAFVGFFPTYWWRLANGTFVGTPVQHIHGALFFTWYLFFLSQTVLVASHRTSSHRAWGMAGISIATAMAISMLLVIIDAIQTGELLGVGDARRRFSILPFSTFVLFTAFFALAIVNVKKPDVHKRFMVLASVPMLQAAMARIFMTLFAPPGQIGPPPMIATLAPGAVVDLLLVAAMLYDKRTRGRIHPVYLVGVPLVVLKQLLVVPLSESQVWLELVTRLEALAG